jgi:poly(A) polymerase
MTGFEIPAKLRNRIKLDAPLLTNISPSRLTEEIVKIITSNCPASIISLLETYGLYQYLQPNASGMMAESEKFKERYMRSLADLTKKSGQKSGAIRALIEDYLELNTDWDSAAPELFRKTFFAARKFILPMSPQRMELGNAVREIFADHGIVVKKPRPLYLRGWGNPEDQ